MSIKEEIKKILTQKIKKEFGDFALPEITVEKPKEISHGDYSTSIALAISKHVGKSPLEIAKSIAASIESPLFKKVEAVAPGFINFSLADNYFQKNTKTILKEKNNFGKNQTLKNKKVIVEYTDPNILKEFHIGHLMTNVIGESVAHILEFQGAKVKRANYQGDVGMHIAKALFGKLQKPELSWQEAYVLGSARYEESVEDKAEMMVLNKKVFERSDKAVNKIYDQGKVWSLAYFETIYKKLGTKFDYYFFESEVFQFGVKTVLDGLKKGIFETGEKGAIIFKGENVGLHTRVFINSEGLPTYEAKELGLAHIKYKKYPYDISVISTGGEIKEYFKVLLAVMSQIFPDLARKTKHLGHGMLRLPTGKMSSRTGHVIAFMSLLSEVESMVAEKIQGRDVTEKEKTDIIEKVSIASLKYSILKQSIGSDIIFDAEKSISFEGDSGPYLQYSYARAQSILRKAKVEKIKPSLKYTPVEVSQLEKMMHYFPEIVEKAGKEYEPHYIALYITELAREFNNYYAHHKIVDKGDEFSSYKLGLTEAFSVIMKNGLWLLGIQAPEKM